MRFGLAGAAVAALMCFAGVSCVDASASPIDFSAQATNGDFVYFNAGFDPQTSQGNIGITVLDTSYNFLYDITDSGHVAINLVRNSAQDFTANVDGAGFMLSLDDSGGYLQFNSFSTGLIDFYNLKNVVIEGTFLVPLPSSIKLMGMSLIGVACAGWLRRRSQTGWRPPTNETPGTSRLPTES